MSDEKEETKITLTLEQAIDVQNQLICGYMTRDFQEKIWQCAANHSADQIKFMTARSEICNKVQFPVIEKFGFEPSRKGVALSVQAFTPAINANPTVAEKNNLMQYLINPDQQQEIATKSLTPPLGVPPSRVRSPQPEEYPESSTGRVWQVVGGVSSGGIKVRKEEGTDSPEMAQRLATGAMIEEIEKVGDRLKFEKMSLGGPDLGWVNCTFKDKPIVVPLYFTPDASLASEKTVTYKVVHDRVAKRATPSKDGKMSGAGKKGEKVKGIVMKEGDVEWLKVREKPLGSNEVADLYMMIDGASVGLGVLLEKA